MGYPLFHPEIVATSLQVRNPKIPLLGAVSCGKGELVQILQNLWMIYHFTWITFKYIYIHIIYIYIWTILYIYMEHIWKYMIYGAYGTYIYREKIKYVENYM